MFFASDNGAPATPEVMNALIGANSKSVSAYGADPYSDQAVAKIRDIFEAPDAAVFFVATGTAANALSLSCLVQPWQNVFCHRNAHVEEDECGAPEFFTGGAKMTLLDGEHAKMTPKGLADAIAFTGRAGVHNVQAGALSITSPTENGTVYSLEELKALTKVARDAGLPCHLDGARFANGLVALGCTPAEMTWKAGFDAVSFGGTKNGCYGAEAVILFDPEKAWEFELRRKRAGHLFSKHRLISAQILGYLENDAWLDRARDANARAAQLAAAIGDLPNTRFDHPPQANMVFASFPRAAHKRAIDAGAYYYFWPMDHSLDGPADELLSARLVCNWSTTAQEIDQFATLLRG